MKTKSVITPAPARAPKPSMLTTKEVAAWTKTSEAKWQRHRADGTGPRHFKIGGAVRYCIDDVQDWLRVHSCGGWSY